VATTPPQPPRTRHLTSTTRPGGTRTTARQPSRGAGSAQMGWRTARRARRRRRTVRPTCCRSSRVRGSTTNSARCAAHPARLTPFVSPPTTWHRHRSPMWVPGCLGAWVPGLLGAWVPWLLSVSRPTVTDSHLRVCPPAPFPNRVWHALLVLQLAATLWQCAVCEAHQCVHAWGAIGDRQMLLPPLFASCYSWDDHPNTRVDFGEWFDVSHSDGPAHCHNHRALPPLWLRPTHES
jgi:hypothetical protein